MVATTGQLLHFQAEGGIVLVSSMVICLTLVLVSIAATIMCCFKKQSSQHEKKEETNPPRYENVDCNGQPLTLQPDLEGQPQRPSAYENVGAGHRPLAPQPDLGTQRRGTSPSAAAAARAMAPTRSSRASSGMPAAGTQPDLAVPKHQWDSTQYSMTILKQDRAGTESTVAPPVTKHSWDGTSYDMTTIAGQGMSTASTQSPSLVVDASPSSSGYSRVTVAPARQQDHNRPAIFHAAHSCARQLQQRQQQQRQQAKRTVQAGAGNNDEDEEERERISISSGTRTFVITDRETVRCSKSKQPGARQPLSGNAAYTYAVPRNTVRQLTLTGLPERMSTSSTDAADGSASTGIEVHTESGAALLVTDALETDASQEFTNRRRVILDYSPY